MLYFVSKNFGSFLRRNKNSPTKKYVSKIYFEAISVGVALALKEKPSLIEKENIDTSWLESEEFNKVLGTVFNTHSPKLIKNRIHFVKEALIQYNGGN